MKQPVTIVLLSIGVIALLGFAAIAGLGAYYSIESGAIGPTVGLITVGIGILGCALVFALRKRGDL